MKHWPALLLLTGCAIPESAKDTLVFGHGGMGPDNLWPMDSREAITACLASGADGVEIDVHMTADSILVAYHDEDLSTTTTCDGRINGHRWSELVGCGYPEYPMIAADGSPPGLVGLMAINDLLSDSASWAGVRFTLDCKLFAAGDWDSYLNAYAYALDSLVGRHRLQGRVNVECMDVGFLDRVKRGVPGVAVFYYATSAVEGIALAREHGFTGITIDHRLITVDQVGSARSVGLQVALFGIGGSWSHRRALALDADMIQTDDVPGLLRLLGR